MSARETWRRPVWTLSDTMTVIADWDGDGNVLDYDGDQQRIRKTTPHQETVTVGNRIGPCGRNVPRESLEAHLPSRKE